MLRWMRRILLGLLLTFAVIAVLLVLPYPTSATMHAQPASSYDDAIRRLSAIHATESELQLYPGCESRLLTDGVPTERVAVLFHGYRSCPLQFQLLGERLHRLGYNVLIPRMPRMGFRTRPNEQHGALSVEELVRYGTESLDIAQGLGGEVTVIGFSVGGLMAAWAAQFRDDVDHAVIISPFLEPEALPDALARPAVNLFRVMPNRYLWQDPELKGAVPNPGHVYQRNATRALAEIMRLGFALSQASNEAAPAADTLVFVANEADDVVDPDPVRELIDAWRGQGHPSVETFHFDAELGLDHDLIDPAHPRAKVDLSYPMLMQSILRR
jgi:pimeloyl-ACP methyl ester carboxylesterase